MPKPLMYGVIYPLLLIIAAALGLEFAGLGYVAGDLSLGGTALVVLIMLLYTSIWHSRSRWPGTAWIQRLDNMLRFKR